MTTTRTRAPLALVQQRRQTGRRLHVWLRLRDAALARMQAAFAAIDNNASDEASEPACLAHLQAGRVYLYCHDRVVIAIGHLNASERALIAALRGLPTA